jgi:hypothetical protein
MINFAEARVIGQLAGPGALFDTGSPDSNPNVKGNLLVLKVPLMVNSRRRKKGSSGERTKGQSFTINIWGKNRISNFLKHCPTGTQIHVRGSLNHEGKKNADGTYTQYASINAIDLDYGMRSQKGLKLTHNEFRIWDPAREEMVTRKVELAPLPDNTRAGAVSAQTAPSSVGDLAAEVGSTGSSVDLSFL